MPRAQRPHADGPVALPQPEEAAELAHALLAARLLKLQGRLERLTKEITEFWWPTAYDTQQGGFHGSLDRQGRPGAPSHKTIVQQARHLWALSAYLQRRGARTPPSNASFAQDLTSLAQGTYAFLSHFHDERDGRFFWEVDRQGTALNAHKVVYGQAFALLGLSRYAMAFGDTDALSAALDCFDALDSICHDAQFGGYHEFGDPSFITGGSAKDTNTHIHLMEAFAELHDATSEPRVRKRLHELTELVCNRLQRPEGHLHLYFERDFTPFGRPRVSYGHDIETAWLLLDAARSLGLNPDTVADFSLLMGRHAIAFGFDARGGGFFDEGIPRGRVTCFEKVWWAQFEGLAGLWWLFRLTGEQEHLTRMERTLDWIEGSGRDRTFGEWYFGVLPNGTPSGHGTGKGDVWKATYHNLRATLFVADWIEAVLAEADEKSPTP